MRLLKRLGLDQTRIQIFIGFIAAMALVLAMTVGSIYMLLSLQQKKNAQQYTDEIAVQMSGRLQSQLNEINVLTLQLAMDERIQELLFQERNGNRVSYEDRMQVRKMLQEKMVYSETIQEIELFSLEGSIYPMVEKNVKQRAGGKAVERADESLQAGALVWLAQDPEDSDSLLALRQVKIERLGYESGGYLVMKVKRSLIDFISAGDAKLADSTVYLTDENGEIIASDTLREELLSGNLKKEKSFIAVSRHIPETDWMLEILLPQKMVMEGTSFIRYVLLAASAAGIIMFAFLSFGLSQLITSPVKKLSRVMQQGKEGNLQENREQYFNREVSQLNTRYNQLVREINYLIKSVYEIEIMKSKSEITALHSQINPHFLFNTLDCIYWAHISKGEKELSRSIILLADLFRYTIQSNDHNGFVTAEQELEQVKRYAELIKMRWEDRLETAFYLDPSAQKCKIPKLTIQPLVENAVVHGIEPLNGGGRLSVTINKCDSDLIVTVEDNGVGISGSKLAEIRSRLSNETHKELQVGGKGIGLFNVHKLAQLQYGEGSGIEIESVENVGTTVILKLTAKEGT